MTLAIGKVGSIEGKPKIEFSCEECHGGEGGKSSASNAPAHRTGSKKKTRNKGRH